MNTHGRLLVLLYLSPIVNLSSDLPTTASLGHFVLGGIRATTESVSKSTGMQQLYRLYLSASLV